MQKKYAPITRFMLVGNGSAMPGIGELSEKMSLFTIFSDNWAMKRIVQLLEKKLNILIEKRTYNWEMKRLVQLLEKKLNILIKRGLTTERWNG